MTGFTSPIQYGLHLTEDEGRFVMAVSMENPTDEPIRFKTMTGRLLTPYIDESRGNRVWEPIKGATQAVTNWKLAPNSQFVRHYSIPNRADAVQCCRDEIETLRETLYQDTPRSEFDITVAPAHELPTEINYDDELLVTNPCFDPNEVDGTYHVGCVFPSTGDMSVDVSRGYSLQENRGTDTELPDKCTDTITRI